VSAADPFEIDPDDEIGRLGAFLQSVYPREYGRASLRSGEGVVDVAIRLLDTPQVVGVLRMLREGRRLDLAVFEGEDNGGGVGSDCGRRPRVGDVKPPERAPGRVASRRSRPIAAADLADRPGVTRGDVRRATKS
jgi:hypothetical protein